jgi:hypothetical protein
MGHSQFRVYLSIRGCVSVRVEVSKVRYYKLSRVDCQSSCPAPILTHASSCLPLCSITMGKWSKFDDAIGGSTLLDGVKAEDFIGAEKENRYVLIL